MSGKDTSKRTGPLDERIDAALASWPLTERDAAAWENFAARVEARIARSTADATGDAVLLEAPLPATPQEVRQSTPAEGLNVEPANRTAAGPGEMKMSQPPERGRDRRNLKDLAKLASSPSLTPTPPPAKTPSVSPLATTRRSDPGDSGVVDLKMMAQFDPDAAERAKDTKLASAELFDDEPADAPAASEKARSAPSSGKALAAPSSGKALAAAPASSPGARSAEAAPSSARAAAPARTAPKTDEGKTSALVWIAGVGGLFAAAAAAIIMMGSPSSAPTADSPAPPAPVAATATSAPKAAPSAAASVAAADTPAPAKDQNEVDLSALPSAAGSARATAGANKAVAAGPKKAVVIPGASPAAAPEATKPVNPALVANIPMSPTENGALEKELRQAAGTTDNPSGGGAATPSTAPQFDPGSVPQRPSAGAIAGGVSAAMSQARSCLGLDDPISKAAVTFESSGAVRDVVVSGYAAGKPAEGCIKAALSKAKVPPFAQPIYTQTFTVRPNS